MSSKSELQAIISKINEASTLFPPAVPDPDLKNYIEMVVDGESGDDHPFFQQICLERLTRLQPVTEYLRHPRSIADFIQLKKDLLKLIYEGFSIPDTHYRDVEWFQTILYCLGIFPNDRQCDLVRSHEQTVEESWAMYETLEDKKPQSHHKKIINLRNAQRQLREIRREEQVRIGYIPGKWGLGPHQEHLDLFWQAKQALGNGGQLVIGVESLNSIMARRKDHHGILSDEERLHRIAALEMVDKVLYLNPSSSNLQNQQQYFEHVWQSVNPDIVFFGNRDYHWLPRFQERASRKGVFLLWARDINQISTTQLLSDLQKPVS